MTIRKLLKYVLLQGVIVTFCSCSNNNCNDSYDLDKMLFYNVHIDELQNVRLIGYEKTGKFDKIVDNSYEIIEIEYEIDNWYTHQGVLNKQINTELDYKILFDDINDSCLITNIIIEEKVCSQVLFFKKYEYSFKNYTMNGLGFACQIFKAFPTRSD